MPGARPTALWSRDSQGTHGHTGNSELAPKGSFRYIQNIRFGYDNDYQTVVPGSTVELWVVAEKIRKTRFIGGYEYVCKKAVSPSVFVPVPFVPPPSPD